MAEVQQKDFSVQTETCCSWYGFHKAGSRRLFSLIPLCSSIAWKWRPCPQPQTHSSAALTPGCLCPQPGWNWLKTGHKIECGRLQNVHVCPTGFPPVGGYFIRLFGELRCPQKANALWIPTCPLNFTLYFKTQKQIRPHQWRCPWHYQCLKRKKKPKHKAVQDIKMYCFSPHWNSVFLLKSSTRLCL